MKGRTAILKVHTKGKPLDKTIDIEGIARQSPGFSGADLANLVNEAAILAARRNKKTIVTSEFQEALERIVAGPERKSRVISDAEKAIIAFHEGGHAVVQRILPKCDPVQKVTIISRGMALGYTMALPHRGPLPPEQDRVRGQDRRPARRQRRRAPGLRRHHDRCQQRHREGDRPRPAHGHRVRDERQARPARPSASATSSSSSAARSASSATTATTSRKPDRRGGPGDHRPRLRAGDGRPRDAIATASRPWPRSSSPRRPSTATAFETLFADLPPKENTHGGTPILPAGNVATEPDEPGAAAGTDAGAGPQPRLTATPPPAIDGGPSGPPSAVGGTMTASPPRRTWTRSSTLDA